MVTYQQVHSEKSRSCCLASVAYLSEKFWHIEFIRLKQ